MRRALMAPALGVMLLLAGCGVTLQDEPELLDPTATEAPSPAPTVSVQPDVPPVPAPTTTPPADTSRPG